MATRTAGGRQGRTIYMADESWNQLVALSVPQAARAGDSAKLEALVTLVPKLREDLAAAQKEVARLREDLKRVEELGLQVEVAQAQVEAALSTVIQHLQPVQHMVWQALRR